MVASGPRINKAVPSSVGNTGSVTLAFMGVEFNSLTIAEVKVWGDSGVEYPGEILEVSTDGTYFTAKFNLTGATEGDYNVKALFPDTNGNLTEISLSDAFTVEAGKDQNVWVDITGSTVVRYGSSTTYYIWYGNSGNTNVLGALLYIGIPKGLSYTLGFDTNDYSIPVSYSIDSLYPNGISSEAEITVDSQEYNVIQLFIRNIPPFASTPLAVTVTWGSEPVDQTLQVWWSGSNAVTDYNPLNP